MHQLKWNKELSVDVPLIDDQHKELIRIANGSSRGYPEDAPRIQSTTSLASCGNTRSFISTVKKSSWRKCAIRIGANTKSNIAGSKPASKIFNGVYTRKRKYHPRKYSTFSRNGCLPTSCPTILIWQISSGTSGQIKRSQPKRRQPLLITTES